MLCVFYHNKKKKEKNTIIYFFFHYWAFGPFLVFLCHELCCWEYPCTGCIFPWSIIFLRNMHRSRIRQSQRVWSVVWLGGTSRFSKRNVVKNSFKEIDFPILNFPKMDLLEKMLTSQRQATHSISSTTVLLPSYKSKVYPPTVSSLTAEHCPWI